MSQLYIETLDPNPQDLKSLAKMHYKEAQRLFTLSDRALERRDRLFYEKLSKIEMRYARSLVK